MEAKDKRILIWQDLLVEMPPEHRRAIEGEPYGELFDRYAEVVRVRLADWEHSNGRVLQADRQNTKASEEP